MHSFLFRELQLITVFFKILSSYILVFLKLCLGLSISDSALLLFEFTFLLNKNHGLINFKTS